MVSRQRIRQLELIALGLCKICGKLRERYTIHCNDCHAEHMVRHTAYMKRKRVKESGDG